MKPTLEQCYNQSRALMGDDEVAGGQIFTDSALQPHTVQAIRELFRVLRGAQDPFVLADAYFVLPANTSVFDPATAGMFNLPEPEYVSWTTVPAGSPTAITNVVMTTGATPYATVTSPSHGIPIGSFPTVIIYGVLGFDQFNNINQSWAAQVIDANTIQCNGCTQTGTYVSGGFTMAVNLTNQFIPMAPQDTIENVAVLAPSPALSETIYAWEGGVFRFLPSSMARLIKITYRMSGMVDTNPNAVVPIDDCQDYIATRAAGIAGKTRGASARGAELTMEAIGPTGMADGSGGILRQLLAVDIRNMQRIQYRQRPFRPRRNRQDYLLY
jgi:hypothetical protein